MRYTHFYRCPMCKVRYQFRYDYASAVWSPLMVEFMKACVELEYQTHVNGHVNERVEAVCRNQ